MKIIPETADHVFPQLQKVELSGKTESFNILLRRKGQFQPVATVINFEIPVELSDDQKVISAAREVMKNFDIKLEPITGVDAIVREFLKWSQTANNSFNHPCRRFVGAWFLPGGDMRPDWKPINVRKEKPKKGAFKPNRAYIEKAVSDFLNRGGKITVIEPNEESFRYFVSVNDPVSVDAFLMGE